MIAQFEFRKKEKQSEIRKGAWPCSLQRNGRRIIIHKTFPSAGGSEIEKIIYPDSDGKPMNNTKSNSTGLWKSKKIANGIFADNPDVFNGGRSAVVSGMRKQQNTRSLMRWSFSANPRTQECLECGKKYRTMLFFEFCLRGTDRERCGKARILWIWRSGILYLWIRIISVWADGFAGKMRLYPVENMQGWVSPLRKIRFQLLEEMICIFLIRTGTDFFRPWNWNAFWNPNRKDRNSRAESGDQSDWGQDQKFAGWYRKITRRTIGPNSGN